MTSALEAAGPEGTLFLLFILATLSVIVLRRIQSLVQKIDYRIYSLIPVLAVLLLVVIVNLAREDGPATVENGFGVGQSGCLVDRLCDADLNPW